VEVVAALGVGVAIGLLLDRWLGTWPWLFLLFFVAGSAAGILNVYRLFNPRHGRRE
jgi:ATP synthase protein I